MLAVLGEDLEPFGTVTIAVGSLELQEKGWTRHIRDPIDR